MIKDIVAGITDIIVQFTDSSPQYECGVNLTDLRKRARKARKDLLRNGSHSVEQITLYPAAEFEDKHRFMVFDRENLNV